jgi:hypothetical protein|nr:hypothetical protein [uncultured Prevotella sp.]
MATEIIRPAGFVIRRDVSLTTSGKLLNREFAPTTKRILLRIISLGATVESITDDNVESRLLPKRWDISLMKKFQVGEMPLGT